MFMRGNIFKNFRKDEDCLNNSTAKRKEPINSSEKDFPLWGGLGSDGVSCDLDDEDEFESNSFMLGSSVSDLSSFDDAEWSTSDSFTERKNHSTRSKIGSISRQRDNVRKNVKPVRSEEEKDMLKKFDAAGLTSPPSSSRNKVPAAASSMLNFLKKRSSDDISESIDSRINSSTDTVTPSFSRTQSTKCEFVDEFHSPTLENQVTESEPEMVDSRSEHEEGYYKDNNNLNHMCNMLRIEMEDIRKWKKRAAEEIEDKTKQLKRAEITIENLRKSNLELQVNGAHKLFLDESRKREHEIQQRARQSWPDNSKVCALNKWHEGFEEILKEVHSVQAKCEQLETEELKICHGNEEIEAKISETIELYDALNKVLLEHIPKCANKIKFMEEEAKANLESNTCLKSELNACMDEVEMLKESILTETERHNMELKELQKEIDKLSTNNVELHECKESLSNKCKDTERLLLKKERDVTSLEEELKLQKEEAEVKESQIKAINQELQLAKASICEKSIALETAERFRGRLEEETTKLKYELDSLKSECQKEKKSIAESLRMIHTNVECMYNNSHIRDNICLEEVITGLKDEYTLKSEIIRLCEENMKYQEDQLYQIKKESAKLSELTNSQKFEITGLKEELEKLKVRTD
ncbi:unnamed protein product [Dicrocoelium dendriticum]|nr:unnamed protein product [Dicrocoelium dendriticum]